jgi:hypothetical protein
VLHCWAPLQAAFDNMDVLHAKALEQLEVWSGSFQTWQRTSQTVRRRSPRQMRTTTMRSQRRKRRARSERAQRLSSPSMAALLMRLLPTVSLRSGHRAPRPRPRMQQWMHWMRVASLREQCVYLFLCGRTAATVCCVRYV